MRMSRYLNSRHRIGSRGFTLVELMLAFAITSMLAVIAIAGQSALSQRARFDSAVNQTIQNIAFARTYSTSNVNTDGGGNDTSSELIGDSIEFDNNHHYSGYPLEEMAPSYAVPDAQGYPDVSNILETPADYLSNPAICPAADHPEDNDECFERFFNLAEPLIMLDPNAPGYTTNYKAEYTAPNVSVGIVFFINTGSGVYICHQTDTVQVDATHACVTNRATPFDFVLVDDNGLHATLEVDPNSGFAKRLD